VSSDLEPINPPELCVPSGFSHAVRAGDTLHLAGQTALDENGAIVGGTIVDQFERALGNLLTALRAAGGAPSDLASLTLYIVDIENYRAHAAEIGRVWHRLLGRHYPAMAAIGVARLWDAEALIEVQGVAHLG
jgi:enamine deaminase RidA (YjgF/YER057c/UK114 family)